jgi:hypothetical protein
MLGHDEVVRTKISVCSGVSAETGGLSIDLSAVRQAGCNFVLPNRSFCLRAEHSDKAAGSSGPETETKNAIERQCRDFSLLANATLMLVESL